MKKILFVCMGNICRSPTAEGVFRKLVDVAAKTSHSQSEWMIDSAGTIGYHEGSPADHRMKVAAAKRDYSLDSISRKVVADDFSKFDLIIAMDRDNFDDLKRISGKGSAEIKLLSEFLDDSWPTDVPDPYYGGADGFDYVVDMIEAACPAIMRSLSHSDEC